MCDTIVSSLVSNDLASSFLSSLSDGEIVSEVVTCEVDDSPTCSICMEEYQFNQAGHIKECQHAFCHPCILQWSTQKSSCPLCLMPFTGIISRDATTGDTTEHVVAAKDKFDHQDERVNLDCLDHSYFLAEISRLLNWRKQLELTLFRDGPRHFHAANKFGSLKGTADYAIYGCLQHTREHLDSRLEQLRTFAQFDPSTLLAELYDVEENLQQIRDGTYGHSVVDTSEPVRYSAADCEYLDDDYDDDYDDGYVPTQRRASGSGRNKQTPSKSSTQKSATIAKGSRKSR
eukprot:GILK01002413.1.p1 GENE.GILK01002413.1~~GILK01002413.1.p1  ORF type:complete len:288 (-),score=9.20 GILK01002413.1:269-1132(-)